MPRAKTSCQKFSRRRFSRSCRSINGNNQLRLLLCTRFRLPATVTGTYFRRPTANRQIDQRIRSHMVGQIAPRKSGNSCNIWKSGLYCLSVVRERQFNRFSVLIKFLRCLLSPPVGEPPFGARLLFLQQFTTRLLLRSNFWLPARERWFVNCCQ